jgi:predicted anti-sigma-YlaC factor YlaD
MSGKVRTLLLIPLLASTCGCGFVRGRAISMVGSVLAEGGGTFESDDDVDLIGAALPAMLKVNESLIDASPRDKNLLLSAARGFTGYSYAFVQWEAEQIRETDLGESRRLNARAARLHMRAHRYGMRGLDAARNGFAAEFAMDREAAVERLREDDLPLIYWTAASLGLAISTDRNNPAMLVRLPDVEALLDRAFELDESWEDGALHEFEVVFAPNRPGAPDYDAIREHFERAEELSAGSHAGLYVSYAETVGIPQQDSGLFRSMLEQALAIDVDEHEETRLINLIAQERAQWLLERTEDLILDPGDVE